MPDTAEQAVRRAQDMWEADARAEGHRPDGEQVSLQLHFHLNTLYGGSRRRGRSYWHASCAVRPTRLPNRWRIGYGDDPESALRALLRELGG